MKLRVTLRIGLAGRWVTGVTAPRMARATGPEGSTTIATTEAASAEPRTTSPPAAAPAAFRKARRDLIEDIPFQNRSRSPICIERMPPAPGRTAPDGSVTVPYRVAVVT